MNKKKKEQKGKEKDLKLSFLQKLNISIVNFEHYYVIAADGWKRAILYLVKLLLIFSTVLTCFITYKTSMNISSICSYAKNELPFFEIKEKKFNIDSDEPIIIENKAATKIIIDDKNPETNYINNPKDSKKNLIIITKDGLFINSYYAGDMQYSFENLSTLIGTDNLTKDELIEILSDNTLILGIFVYVFIAIFVMYFVSMLIDIIALSIVGHLFSRIIGLPLKYSATFAMATSAMSLPIILTLVYFIMNLLTGFTINYFQIMLTIVSYIYMLAAMFIMRSNLIKGDYNEEKEIKKVQIRKIENDDNKVDEE